MPTESSRPAYYLIGTPDGDQIIPARSAVEAADFMWQQVEGQMWGPGVGNLQDGPSEYDRPYRRSDIQVVLATAENVRGWARFLPVEVPESPRLMLTAENRALEQHAFQTPVQVDMNLEYILLTGQDFEGDNREIRFRGADALRKVRVYGSELAAGPDGWRGMTATAWDQRGQPHDITAMVFGQKPSLDLAQQPAVSTPDRRAFDPGCRDGIAVVGQDRRSFSERVTERRSFPEIIEAASLTLSGSHLNFQTDADIFEDLVRESRECAAIIAPGNSPTAADFRVAFVDYTIGKLSREEFVRRIQKHEPILKREHLTAVESSRACQAPSRGARLLVGQVRTTEGIDTDPESDGITP